MERKDFVSYEQNTKVMELVSKITSNFYRQIYLQDYIYVHTGIKLPKLFVIEMDFKANNVCGLSTYTIITYNNFVNKFPKLMPKIVHDFLLERLDQFEDISIDVCKEYYQNLLKKYSNPQIESLSHEPTILINKI